MSLTLPPPALNSTDPPPHRNTSLQLSTNTTVVVSYGRIETRVKLPKGQGLWPSIWMLPHDSPYGGWASGGSINILHARNEMSRAHGCESRVESFVSKRGVV